MAKRTSSFTTYLDCGVLGEIDVEVQYSAYRPAREAEDDYRELDIISVSAKVGNARIDVTTMLSCKTNADLEEQAWEDSGL